MQKKLLLLFGLFLFLISGCGILNNENPKNDLNKGTLNVFFSYEEKEGEEISLKLYKKELDKVFELNNQQTEVTFPLNSGLRVMELVVKKNEETIKTRILECEILKGGNKQVEITVSRNSSGGVAITFDDKFVDSWYSAKDLF